MFEQQASAGIVDIMPCAGSERVGKSEATGDRLEEAKHINKSLSALGKAMTKICHMLLNSVAAFLRHVAQACTICHLSGMMHAAHRIDVWQKTLPKLYQGRIWISA